MTGRHARSARFAFAAGLAALALASCSKAPQQSAANDGQPAVAPPIAALPLATATPPAPAAAAPVAAALPAPAKAIPVAAKPRDDRYYYVDGAYSMDGAFGDTPPDYTVDYDGTRPWVWRSDSGAYRVVERLPAGERYYYYQPGTNEPFYVTDQDGSYAYDGGELVGVYGPNGVPLDYALARQRADEASRYLYRARALYQAAQHDQRQAAYAAEWQQRRDAIIGQRTQWQAARARDAQWQAWHDAHVQQERQAWQSERDRRLAYAAAIGGGAAAGAAFLAHDRDRDHDIRVRQQQQDAAHQQAMVAHDDAVRASQIRADADAQRRQMAADHQHDAQIAQARQQQAHDDALARQRDQAQHQHQADQLASARADVAHRQAMADQAAQHREQVADARRAQADHVRQADAAHAAAMNRQQAQNDARHQQMAEAQNHAREQAQAQQQHADAARQQHAEMQQQRMQAQHQEAAHQQQMAQMQAQHQQAQHQAEAHQQAARAQQQQHAMAGPHQPNGPHHDDHH